MIQQAAPLAVFIGTTPNIGTTAASFAAAFRIAEASGKPVGFLCLHLKSAKLHRYLGIDEPEVTLDKLQPDLRSYTLTADKLRRASYSLPSLPNLHILFGNMHRDQAEFYRPEEIDHLLSIAGQAFSFVVADVGAYWDNAATVCSIRRASSRILMTTSALSHFQEDGRRWIGQVSPLFNVPPQQYDCVVIQYPWGTGGYRMKHICKELNVSSLGKFHMSESLFNQLDSGTYNEWLNKDHAGKAAMLEPANTLMKRHQIRNGHPPMSLQPWYRKLLAHRKGVSSS